MKLHLHRAKKCSRFAVALALIASALTVSANPTPGQISVALAGGHAALTWNSAPGIAYCVQTSDALASGTWTTAATIVAGGNLTSWTDPTALASSRFYRLLYPGGLTSLFEAPPQNPVTEPCGCTSCGAEEASSYFLYPFSGELHYSTEDLRIKGRGLDFVWARKYRSRVGPNTAQGNGWDFSYNIRVQHIGPNLEILDGNTRSDVYCPQPDGTYAANQFFRSGTLSNGVFTLQFADTSTWKFRPLDGSAAQGKIDAITDRNSNALHFTYDGNGRLIQVNDTLNRNIQIGYNADGFISSVTDFTGRQVTYQYYNNADLGGVFGDLKSVTSPVVVGTPNGNDFPLGKTWTYTYSSGLGNEQLNHNLLTIADAKGQTFLRANYSSVSDPADFRFDRTVSVYWGNSNDVIMASYVPQVPAPSNYFARIKVILNDRMGNVSEYLYDGGNRCVDQRAFTGRAIAGQPTTESQNRPTSQLRTNDPPYFETSMQWNADSLLTRVVYPNGNSTENTYELALNPAADPRARGNLRNRRQLPGPLGGDQAQIVESFDYAPGFSGCCGFNFVTNYVDGRSNHTFHIYDARGNRIHTQQPIPSVVEDWEYNAFGQMTAHVLPDNGSAHRRRDEFSYYSSGAQTGYMSQQVVDAGGFALTTAYEYDAVGNLVRKIDPRGHDTLYLVNALNQAVRETSREVTDGGGIRYQRDTAYDANNNVIRLDVQNIDDQGVLQPNNYFTTGYDYEILNKLTRVTQEVDAGHNVVTEYGYDPNRNQTLVRYGQATAGTDPFNIRVMSYDERNLLFQDARAPGNTNQSTVRYSYDSNGNLVRVEQGIEDTPRVNVTTLDGFNRRSTATDPMGNVTSYHYDANGNLVSQQTFGELFDVPGSVSNVFLSGTAFIYDAMNRQVRSDRGFFDTQTHTPIGDGAATVQTFYSDNSQVVTNIDDNNHIMRYTYDGANRRTLVTDAKGNTATLTYDANGNVILRTEVDKSDLGSPDQIFSTTFAYDNLDRLARAVDNINNTNQYAYDSRNNHVFRLDARSNVVRYLYDGLNRLIQTARQMTDTGNGAGTPTNAIITSQSWDDDSRLTGQTDSNTNTTSYAYDSLSRLIRETGADNTDQNFAYDVHDNRTGMADANSNVVTVAYDLLNRATNKVIIPGPGVTTNKTFQSYQYDGLGRIVRAVDNDSVVTRNYDSLSQPTIETQQVLPTGPIRTVACVYDGVGNQLSCTYPGGRAITHTYDSLDRNATIADSGGTIATYSYIGPTRLEQRDSGNGTRLLIGYDGVRRIIGTAHSKITGGQPIDFRGYQWDPMYNKVQANAFTTPPAPDNRSYRYDSSSRLIHTEHATITPPPPTDYFLDGVGNRTSVAGSPDPGNYTMNGGLPEPADAQMNQYTTTPFDARIYDANGNLRGTSNPPRQYAYDYRNQLTQFTDLNTAQTTTYKYDCLGRRIEKNVAGNVTRFYYDGWREIEEQNSIGTTLATFVWGNGLDELLEMTRSGQTRWFHADDLGSVAKVTDATGNVLEAYSFSDYGQPAILDPAGNPIPQSLIGNSYLFTGRRLDPETGWYYYRTRYLDPRAGRFTSPDSIGAWGDSFNQGNAYAYVGNEPVSSADPYGTGPFNPEPPTGFSIVPGSLKAGGDGEIALGGWFSQSYIRWHRWSYNAERRVQGACDEAISGSVAESTAWSATWGQTTTVGGSVGGGGGIGGDKGAASGSVSAQVQASVATSLGLSFGQGSVQTINWQCSAKAGYYPIAILGFNVEEIGGQYTEEKSQSSYGWLGGGNSISYVIASYEFHFHKLTFKGWTCKYVPCPTMKTVSQVVVPPDPAREGTPSGRTGPRSRDCDPPPRKLSPGGR